MKKKISIFLCVLAILSCSVLPTSAIAYPQEKSIYNEENEIQPRTDIKQWRYKVENGNLYKRLYNYSTGHWETDCIFVMSGVVEL